MATTNRLRTHALTFAFWLAVVLVAAVASCLLAFLVLAGVYWAGRQ